MNHTLVHGVSFTVSAAVADYCALCSDANWCLVETSDNPSLHDKLLSTRIYIIRHSTLLTSDIGIYVKKEKHAVIVVDDADELSSGRVERFARSHCLVGWLGMGEGETDGHEVILRAFK